jgi:hypothetical protein
MKSRNVLAGVLLAMLATSGWAAAGGAGAGAGAASIEGVWRCQMEGLPAVTLTVTEEGGTLTGAVLFYLHKREPGQPVSATPGVPEPLLNPRFDGKTLRFQVSHRRAHPPGSFDDEPVNFQLRLDGPNRGEFVNESEQDPNRPRYVLQKSAY